MKRRTFLKTTMAAVALAVSAASLAVRTAVADVCSKVRRCRRGVKLPPLPKWNKLTDDIDSADYFRRCQDYERSLLPRDVVFPRTGQIWEAVRDCEVPLLPYVFSPRMPVPWPSARFRKSEQVRILELDDPKPLQVRFEPLNPKQLPEAVASFGFRYELCMSTAPTVPVPGQKMACFNECFRLVEDVI